MRHKKISLNTRSSFIVMTAACVSVIMLMVFFAFSLSGKGTFSSVQTSEPTYTCSSSGWSHQSNLGSTHICCPSGSTAQLMSPTVPSNLTLYSYSCEAFTDANQAGAADYNDMGICYSNDVELKMINGNPYCCPSGYTTWNAGATTASNACIKRTKPQDATPTCDESAGWFINNDGVCQKEVAEPVTWYAPVNLYTAGTISESGWRKAKVSDPDEGFFYSEPLYNQQFRSGTVVTLPTTTLSGFTFDGWYSDVNYTNKVGSTVTMADTTIPKRINLYAGFRSSSCSGIVNFVGECSSVAPMYTIKLLNFDSVDDQWAEWWERWNIAEGTYSSTFAKNTKISLPPGALRSGKRFTFWNTILTGTGTNYAAKAQYTVTGTQNLYAQWAGETSSYAIAYAGMTGATPGTNHPTTGTANIKVTIDNPTKDGYTFTGWTSSASQGLSTATAEYDVSGGGEVYVAWSGSLTKTRYFKNLNSGTGTVTLTANWSQNTTPTTDSYTIAYNINGGTWDNIVAEYHPTTANIGAEVTIACPFKRGYECKWKSSTSAGLSASAQALKGQGETSALAAWDGSEITSNKFKNLGNANGTVTMTAVWVPDTYKIRYNYNGGTGHSNDPTQGTFDTEITVQNPTREGYTFAGWTAQRALTEAIPSGSFDDDTARYLKITDNSQEWSTWPCDGATCGPVKTSNVTTQFKNLWWMSDWTVELTANWTEGSYRCEVEWNRSCGDTIVAGGAGVTPDVKTKVYKNNSLLSDNLAAEQIDIYTWKITEGSSTPYTILHMSDLNVTDEYTVWAPSTMNAGTTIKVEVSVRLKNDVECSISTPKTLTVTACTSAECQPETSACYISNHEYKWLTTTQGSGLTKATDKTTASACTGCVSGYTKVGGVCTTPTTPTPTPKPTGKCYLVSHKYVWSTTAPSGGVEQSGKTEAQCTGCESGYTSSGGVCTKPTTTTSKCYLVNHKYTWASTKPSGGVEQSGKTQAQCTGCESGYTENSSGVCTKPTTTTSKCYLVDHKYTWASTKPSGGVEQSGKTQAQCTGCESGYTANSGGVCTTQTPPDNPQTGTTAIIIAWIAGLIAIGYSFWYFVKSSKIKNN